jgi:hypothetical protein
MRSTKLLMLIPALALALAGCKKEGVEGPLAGCQPVNSYASSCSTDAECCSFGCAFGTCMPNPLEGGVCRTHGDCAGGRLCIGERCTSSVSCIPVGACTPGGPPCCNGACTAGTCAPDSPPVAVPGRTTTGDVPFRIPAQLTNGSYDPDGTGLGLSYTWSVIGPPGSVATFQPSASYHAPTFTPDVIGAYTITLRAQNAGGYDDTSITFLAVNTPPTIDMPPDILGTTYQSRNVPLAFSATVADADGGPITCTWAKKGPTAVDFTAVSGPTTCAGASGQAASGVTPFTLLEDEAGPWELRLTVDDGVNPPVPDSRFVSVKNDPPVLLPEPSTAKMATRYGNLRSQDLIPLHGSVFDRNGDAVTWQWSMTGVKPAGSTAARFVPDTADQQDVHFEPDVEGLYTLNLHVDDGHGGTADKAVDVIVGPYVLPLARIVDAAFVAGKMVLIGEDAGTYKLWVVDPAVPQIAGSVTFTSLPTALGVSQDGTQAVVARVGGEWDLVNLTTVTLSGASRTGLGFDASSIAWANGRVYATSLGGTVRRLIPGAVAPPYHVVPEQPASFPPISGTRAVGSATHLWVLGGTAGAGALSRYLVDTNDQVRDPVQNLATSLASASGMWLSATTAELFFGGKLDVHDADSVIVPHLPALGTLPVAPTHVGTMDDGGTLVGVISQATSTSLTRFAGPGFTETTPSVVIPFIGENGEKRDPEGRFAFVTKVGGLTTYYAIIAVDRGTATTADDMWGLFTITP